MRILHLSVSAQPGGIEVLLRNNFRLSKHENHYAFLWAGGRIADEMLAEGADISVLDVKRDGMYSTLKKVAAICKEKKIEAVISHNSAPLLKIALLYIKTIMPQTLIIAYAHANAAYICESERKKGLLVRKLVHKLAFSKADGVIAISESVKQSLVDYLKVAPEKIKVIYNGVDIADNKYYKRKQKSRVRLIFIGRLVFEKGVHKILAALANLPKEVDFEFSVVGDGPERDELERLTEKYGLNGKVNFLGTRRDVSELLSEHDIFIHLPECEEGLGITILEAMAAGCICICESRGGIPEIITDGVNGYLVDSDDAAEIAERIGEVISLNAKGNCERIKENACKRASEFNIKHYSKELDNYMRRVVKNKKK